MSATQTPYGLKPVNEIGGLPYAGSTRQIKIASGYASNIFYGQVVSIVAAGTIEVVTTNGDNSTPFPAGTIGVFVGCTYTNPQIASVGLTEAQAKDSVDKGGRLEKQAQKQISQGNFTGARNTARKVQQNEIEQSIRGTGQNRDRRSLSDIGKDFGLRQQMNEKGSDFAKRVKDAKEGNSFADKFGRSVRKGETKSDQDSLSKLGKDKDWFSRKLNVDQPNKDGSKGGDSGGSGGDKNKPQTLDAMVSALLELVKKIEPKLPTSALAA